MPQYADTTPLIGSLSAHIATASTTLVKSGQGTLTAIYFNTPAAGTITIYDSLTASGTVLAVLTATSTAPLPGAATTYRVRFSTGLTIVTSATMDLTVTYF